MKGCEDVQEYEIEFYNRPDGTEPAKDFILNLDKKMQAKVLRTVSLLGAEGPFLREPYSKALDDGLFEIRTKFGSDITRVLYFFVVGKKVILTNGFVKKTQKTPPAEIELAKMYRADYLTRKEKHRYGNWEKIKRRSYEIRIYPGNSCRKDQCVQTDHFKLGK